MANFERYTVKEHLYDAGAKVWASEESCYAVVVKVRRPIGQIQYRYDIIHDDGTEDQYVQEDQLYPSKEAADLDKAISVAQEE